MGRHDPERSDRRMMQRHRVPMRARLLERLGDVIEFDGRLERERDAWNPPKLAIGDHDERPSRAALIQPPAVADVLTPADRDHSLVRIEMRTEIGFAGLQALPEVRMHHAATSWRGFVRYSRQGRRTPRSAATASASS